MNGTELRHARCLHCGAKGDIYVMLPSGLILCGRCGERHKGYTTEPESVYYKSRINQDWRAWHAIDPKAALHWARERIYNAPAALPEETLTGRLDGMEKRIATLERNQAAILDRLRNLRSTMSGL